MTAVREKNKLGEIEFIFEHIFWTLIAMIWYKNILFRCVGNASFFESKVVLWSGIVICSIIGICINMKRNRNYLSIAQNISIAFGIYAIITYMSICPKFIGILLLAMSALLTTCIVLILFRRIPNRKRAKNIIKKRFQNILKSGRTIISMGCAVLLIALGGSVIFRSSILQAFANEAKQEVKGEYTISNKMEELQNLKADTWGKLTVQEKLNVLQIVANIERNYLGLPNELIVGAANLSENLNAYYNNQTHEIVLNMDYVLEASSWQLVQTVCHESYHSYQYRLIEVYDGADESNKELKVFDNVKDYKNEFTNYVNGEEDLYGYANQKCESDAREYAENGLYEYYAKIEGIPE